MVIVDTEKGEDVVGKEWNVRTAVHEVSGPFCGGVSACRTSRIQYGGAPAVAYGGVIYFSHMNDGRLYKLEEGRQPEAVTLGARRFTSLVPLSMC